MMDLLGNFAFVLVRPLQAGNVGSSARALKNMGLGDLRLVAPTATADGRAAASMAVHAGDVLRNARRYDTLGAALTDCTLAVGTTGRPGLYRSGVVGLREAGATGRRGQRKSRRYYLRPRRHRAHQSRTEDLSASGDDSNGARVSVAQSGAGRDAGCVRIDDGGRCGARDASGGTSCAGGCGGRDDGAVERSAGVNRIPAGGNPRHRCSPCARSWAARGSGFASSIS